MPANPETLGATAAYHERLVAMGDRLAALVELEGRALEAAPADRLQEGFRRFMPAVTELTTAGQEVAIATAGGYLRTAGQLEQGRPLEAPASELAGTTPYGSTIAEAMGSAPARAFLALRQGRTTAQAIALATTTAARIAHTELFDAARRTVSAALEAEPGRIAGWRWRTQGTCSSCLGREDGAILPVGVSLNVHPNCQCVQEPVFRGVRERATAPTAEERFRAATPAEQDTMLGPERAELVRTGRVRIADFAHEVPGPLGEPVVDEGTVAEAIAGSRPRGRRRLIRRGRV